MDETMINALLASAADAGLFWAGQRLSRIAQLDQRTALPLTLNGRSSKPV